MQKHRATLVEDLRRKLEEHKQYILQEVEKMFVVFQKEVYDSLVHQQEEQGLYSPDQMHDYEESIHVAITELYERIGMLKGEQCLAALIMFYGEGRHEIQQLKSEISSYVNKHEPKAI